MCPAEFDLGAGRAVVVASVPEGHDKPYKYPGMFAAVDAVLLNKFDLAAYFDFDLAYFRRGVAMVNPDAPVFVVSCRRRDVPETVLARETVAVLQQHSWAGNVRELANALEHAAIMSDGQSHSPGGSAGQHSARGQGGTVMTESILSPKQH